MIPVKEFPHSHLLRMARRTPRQKRVYSLLAAYQHIKRSRLRRRQNRNARQQPSNDRTDTDSDSLSIVSELSSPPSFVSNSFSSLSLPSISSGPCQSDTASGIHPDTRTSGSGTSLDASSDGDSDSSLQDLPPAKRRRGSRGLTYHVRKAISAIYSSRYHLDRKFGRGKPPAYLPLILTTYKDHNEFHHLFRQYLRIDPITFDKILIAISSDPVFINQSRHPQMPIDHQLAITLYRFGYYGNAASLQRVADWAGVGKGTVLIATRHVMTAVLQSSFKDQAIRMPTPGEKEGAKQWVERHSNCPAWRDGWCFVDGTLIPLAFRPFWYGQSYFDRKCNYSLNIQVSSTT
jgi:hypothetical protein